MNYDFAQDVDPVQFVLEEKVGFLHRFKNYVSLLQKQTDERRVLAMSRTGAARDINNYRLVLSCCRGRMPSQNAEELLDTLLEHMDKAWNERRTLGRQMAGVIDQVVLAYVNLATYFESETPE